MGKGKMNCLIKKSAPVGHPRIIENPPHSPFGKGGEGGFKSYLTIDQLLGISPIFKGPL